MKTSNQLAMAQVASVVAASGLEGSLASPGQDAYLKEVWGSAQAATMVLARKKAEKKARDKAKKKKQRSDAMLASGVVLSIAGGIGGAMAGGAAGAGVIAGGAVSGGGLTIAGSS